jgi:hypothetical protein
MNIIQNCHVTVEVVNIADKIFGPDMSSLKGKSTRRKPKPVGTDFIEIPKELIMKHHNVELCMDTMYVNECGMLTANEYQTAQRILSCSTQPYSPALQQLWIRDHNYTLRCRVLQYDG